MSYALIPRKRGVHPAGVGVNTAGEVSDVLKAGADEVIADHGGSYAVMAHHDDLVVAAGFEFGNAGFDFVHGDVGGPFELGDVEFLVGAYVEDEGVFAGFAFGMDFFGGAVGGGLGHVGIPCL